MVTSQCPFISIQYYIHWSTATENLTLCIELTQTNDRFYFITSSFSFPLFNINQVCFHWPTGKKGRPRWKFLLSEGQSIGDQSLRGKKANSHSQGSIIVAKWMAKNFLKGLESFFSLRFFLSLFLKEMNPYLPVSFIFFFHSELFYSFWVHGLKRELIMYWRDVSAGTNLTHAKYASLNLRQKKTLPKCPCTFVYIKKSWFLVKWIKIWYILSMLLHQQFEQLGTKYFHLKNVYFFKCKEILFADLNLKNCTHPTSDDVMTFFLNDDLWRQHCIFVYSIADKIIFFSPSIEAYRVSRHKDLAPRGVTCFSHW